MKVAAVMILGLVAVAYAAPTTEVPTMLTCVCTMQYMPVCGVDGVTYGNSCEMNCAGVAQNHIGACKPPCACPKNLDPVCGSDGKTYDNECMLTCAGGLMLVHQGMCVTKRADIPCICPFIYLPVCGNDGITYGNECSLKCEDGITEVSKGACPLSTSVSTQAPSSTSSFSN